MVKDRELQTLQEDNKLLVKQFRQKKEAQKKREMFSQVITCYILRVTSIIKIITKCISLKQVS